MIVFRRDDIMVMCPGTYEENDSVGWGLFKESGGALAQPRRWPLGSMYRRKQALEVGDSWVVGR